MLSERYNTLQVSAGGLRGDADLGHRRHETALAEAGDWHRGQGGDWELQAAVDGSCGQEGAGHLKLATTVRVGTRFARQSQLGERH